MEKVISAIIGFVLSGVIMSAFDKLIKKYKKKSLWPGFLPNTLAAIVYIIFVFLTVPFFCLMFICGIMVYNYASSGDTVRLILTILLSVLGCFYTTLIVSDMSSRRR